MLKKSESLLLLDSRWLHGWKWVTLKQGSHNAPIANDPAFPTRWQRDPGAAPSGPLYRN